MAKLTRKEKIKAEQEFWNSSIVEEDEYEEEIIYETDCEYWTKTEIEILKAVTKKSFYL